MPGRNWYNAAGALLTGFVRAERFSDGLWAKLIENGAFLRLLNTNSKH